MLASVLNCVRLVAARMLELAKEGARWLCEYEGWGDGVDAPVIEQGQEPQEMLRYLGAYMGGDAREVRRHKTKQTDRQP